MRGFKLIDIAVQALQAGCARGCSRTVVQGPPQREQVAALVAQHAWRIAIRMQGCTEVGMEPAVHASEPLRTYIATSSRFSVCLAWNTRVFTVPSGQARTAAISA